MAKPLYYIKDSDGNEVGVVLSPADYQVLIETGGKFLWPTTPGGKPQGSDPPARIEGRSLSEIVIEDRR
jgi:hypothetical protein